MYVYICTYMCKDFQSSYTQNVELHRARSWLELFKERKRAAGWSSDAADLQEPAQPECRVSGFT